MNTAFAHEEIYPHVHPHPAVAFSTDLVLTLLFVAGLSVLVFLLMKLALAAIRLPRNKE